MVDYSAIGRKSKNKGANFELATAKALSKWWGFEFHRTPASGGLHWGAGNNVTGDIVTPVEANFPFVVECKKREEWVMDNVLLNNKDVKNWWKQVVEDAYQVDKVPMLIFSRNRASSYIMLPYSKKLYDDLIVKQLPVMSTMVTFTDTRKNEHGYEVVITNSDGLYSFTPKYMQNLYKKNSWDKCKRISTKNEEDINEDIDSLINKAK